MKALLAMLAQHKWETAEIICTAAAAGIGTAIGVYLAFWQNGLL